MGKISAISPDLGGNNYGVTINSNSAQVRSTSGPAVTITMERNSNVQAGNEGILFYATPTGFTLDNPGTNANHNAHLTECKIWWTIDGTGFESDVFDAGQVPDKWKSWHRGQGAEMARVFPEGSYTVRVWVWHPTSGECAADEVSFTVGSIDSAVTAANTIVVDPNADKAVEGDWSSAPAHDSGNRCNNYSEVAAIFSAKGAVNVRISFANGTTMDWGRLIATTGKSGGSCYVDTYGAGARPILNYNSADFVTNNGDHQTFKIVSNTDYSFSINGLDFRCGYNPNTMVADRVNSKAGFWVEILNDNVNSSIRQHVTIHNCRAQGYLTSIVHGSAYGTVIMSNYVVQGWQNFGLVGNVKKGKRWGAWSVKIAQDADAMIGAPRSNGDGLGNYHGPMRDEGSWIMAMSLTYGFSCTGWAGTPISYGGKSFYPVQPCWRMLSDIKESGSETYGGDRYGQRGTWERIWSDGGEINCAPAIGDNGLTIVNYGFHDCVVINHFTSGASFKIQHSGVVANNIYMTEDDTQHVFNGLNIALEVKPRAWGNAEDGYQTVKIASDVLEQPININNVTFLSPKTNGEQGGKTPAAAQNGAEPLTGGTTFTNTTIAGVVDSQPNNGETDEEPFTTTSMGYTSPQTGPVLSVGGAQDATYAANNAQLNYITPTTGSSALNSMSSGKAPLDLFGDPRGAAYNAGAIG